MAGSGTKKKEPRTGATEIETVSAPEYTMNLLTGNKVTILLLANY